MRRTTAALGSKCVLSLTSDLAARAFAAVKAAKATQL
jgi:hypothetical protein